MEFLNSIQTPADIYKLTRWEKATVLVESPPLEVDGRTYNSQQEKAAALKAHILDRRTAADDLPRPDFTARPERTIPMSLDVTLEDARRSIIDAGNTTPGSDGITRDMLRAAWEHIGPAITELYKACLRFGYHPKTLRSAEIVMIPKPNKRDLSSPRSWRPISLLKCLSKGLERLVARRMAYYAIISNIVHPTQAGALPKRSTTDLVAALIHDVEQELAKGNLLTLLTMDIQGAFDAVLRNRLITILRRQGWPAAMIRWIYSFLTDRTATIRLQDFLTEAAKLACGLPQGSPLSPILFLLYTLAIYQTLGQIRSFGYADDIAMLFSGAALADTTLQATHAIDTLQAWGAANAVTFDAEKTEIMHFIGRRKDLLDDLPTITHGEREIRCKKAMRWLGIWFDPQLNFIRVT